MLLTKKVKLYLNGSNIKRYEDLGYEIPRYKNSQGRMAIKKGTTITVKIEDLSEGSGHIVDIQCDYCGEVIQRKYNDYVARKNGFEKDSCSECRYIKIKEINSSANTSDDIGYWSQMDNIIKEFIEYVDKHKNINEMSVINPSLNYAIQRSGFSKYDLLLDLGYGLENYIDKRPNGWYDNFDRLANDIIELKNKYGLFPSYHTVIRELKIGNKVFNQYGGYKEIRKMLDDDYEYIDKSGYYNSSFYEVIVANFLCEVGLKNKYQRELYPFHKSDGKFRCDFYFENDNGEKHYCEVWGFDSRDTSVGKYYNSIRKIKEDLYKKYNLNLISIEGWKFDKMKYEDMINYLYYKFKSMIKMPLKTIDVLNIIPSKKLTNQELFNIIKPLMLDGYLPTVTFLQENGYSSYYFEILRRYNSFNNFAKSFGVKTQYNTPNYWSRNKMFEHLDYMIKEYGKTLNQSEISKCQDDKLKKFYGIVRNSKYDGYINIKLDYFFNKVNDGLNIPYEDCEWLYNINKGYGVTENKNITTENRLATFKILTILDNNNMLNNEFKDYNIKTIYTGDERFDVIIDQFAYIKNTYGEFLSYSQINSLKKTDKRLSKICIASRLSRIGISKKEMEDMTSQYIA